jgi:hypothetical protein
LPVRVAQPLRPLPAPSIMKLPCVCPDQLGGVTVVA